MENYKPGQKLTYLPHNKSVEVIHNTLKAGGVNSDEAVVFVKNSTGFILAVPVAVQDKYLTTAPPKKLAPVKKTVAAKK
jgi:hypothetical protein